jgi:putative hydrolase of HD superfamily
MDKNKLEKTINFIFELNQLKREHHRGLTLSGVNEPDTIAEHSLRAAQIGYLLAFMENERAGREVVSAEKVSAMLIIHDNAEARVGDQHKVSARYYDAKEAERLAFVEQIGGLGEGIEEKWQEYMDEYKGRSTTEGIVAKDADWLETAFQAKEYLDIGYAGAQDFIDNVAAAVETESAKEIMREMQEMEFTDWWKDLKKMTYKKLK